MHPAEVHELISARNASRLFLTEPTCFSKSSGHPKYKMEYLWNRVCNDEANLASTAVGAVPHWSAASRPEV